RLKDPLVCLGLSGTPVDEQFDPTRLLFDGVDERQSPRARTGSDPATLGGRKVGVPRGLHLGTAEQPFPELQPQTAPLRLVLLASPTLRLQSFAYRLHFFLSSDKLAP